MVCESLATAIRRDEAFTLWGVIREEWDSALKFR
jgi:hypothetical protein